MLFIKQILLSLLLLTTINAELPKTASYKELQKLTVASETSAPYPNIPLALDGNIMVIGAKYDDVNDQYGAGAAYVYELNNTTGLFTQIARLTASDALTEDHFGSNVAISGDTVIVSSQGSFYGFNSSTNDAGAYIFEKNSITEVFEQVTKLTDEFQDQRFAGQTAISRDNLIVGGSNQLHIYKRNSGTGLFEKSERSISAGYRFFDIDNNRIVVSIPNEGPPGDEWPTVGVVDIYELNISTGLFDQTAKLSTLDATSDDFFGTCVSVSGDTIAIGESSNPYSGITAGALYIFAHNSITGSFEQIDKLTTGSSALSNDYLGQSVDINGDKLITGGRDANNNSNVYIFERSSSSEPFAQTIKLINIDSSFGRHVAISDNRAIIGSSDTSYVFGNKAKISSDFTANGNNDLLWHNSTTGAVSIMEMVGMNSEVHISVVDSSNLNLIPKGIGDFNGDGKVDILVHNQNTGMARAWIMNGTTRLENIALLNSSNTNLQIAGVGDFDRDGDNDIATFNANSGALIVWVMDGTTKLRNETVVTGANVNLAPKGVGDMNNDGIPDIVLRNSNSGAVRVWTMNNNFTRKGNEYVTGSSNTNLELRGVVDIDGDGNSDILNYNIATGKLRSWLMNGNMGILENAEIVQDTDLNWSVRN